jgi:uncharacterized Fe-S center protein
MSSRVYFIPADGKEEPKSISEKALRAYLAAGLHEDIEKGDFAALKIHFGETNNLGHIKPLWLKGIIGEIKKRTTHAFLTDTNTLYIGKRSNSVDHLRLAWSHGFTNDVVGVPVIIADGLIGRDQHEDKDAQARTSSSKIAGAILDSDALICLTHVTGHMQTGIGGTLKNMGMGCASRAGKLDQHSVVHPRVSARQCRNCSICFDYCPEDAIVQAEGHVEINPEKCIGCGECLVVCKHGAIKLSWDEDTRRIQEKVAEYAYRIYRHFKGKAVFLNFLIRITKDCDCMAKDDPPIVEDIGILASLDPVAIDQAAAELVVKRGGGKDPFREGYDVDWSVQLSYGEKLGLGSTEYEIITL